VFNEHPEYPPLVYFAAKMPVATGLAEMK